MLFVWKIMYLYAAWAFAIHLQNDKKKIQYMIVNTPCCTSASQYQTNTSRNGQQRLPSGFGSGTLWHVYSYTDMHISDDIFAMPDAISIFPYVSYFLPEM